MQRNKKIKALFFLSVFSVLLLHQVFPHQHHQHEIDVITETHAHDHHHHHDKSPDKEEDNDSEENLINFIFGMHVHGFTMYEIPLKRTTETQLKTEINVFSHIPSSIYHFNYSNDEAIDIPRIYDPPSRYSNIYFNKLKLRGPPTIG